MKQANTITDKENIYEKRFRMLMKLIRVDQMLKNAEVTHKEIPSDGSA